MGRATSDPAMRKAVLGRVSDENVDFVLLWFTDIVGQLKSFAVTVDGARGSARRRHGLRRVVDHRLQLDRGVGHGGDPRPRHVPGLPWRTGEYKVARMICDVVTPDGQPYEGDPRYVLKRALERMQQMGFETFNIGPELEYFYFRDDDGTRRSTTAATST